MGVGEGVHIYQDSYSIYKFGFKAMFVLRGKKLTSRTLISVWSVMSGSSVAVL